MEEPTNFTFTTPRATTIQEADGAYVPTKYDFEHIFDHDDFEGRVYIVQKFSHVIVKLNKDGTPEKSLEA